MPPISAIVITYNEEANIVSCLQSLRAISDEIIVVDSHSGDRTDCLHSEKATPYHAPTRAARPSYCAPLNRRD